MREAINAYHIVNLIFHVFKMCVRSNKVLDYALVITVCAVSPFGWYNLFIIIANRLQNPGWNRYLDAKLLQHYQGKYLISGLSTRRT